MNTSIRDVHQLVSKYFKVEDDYMFTKNRYGVREQSRERHLFFYMCDVLCNRRVRKREISEYLIREVGIRYHDSTMIFAFNTITDQIQVDKEIQKYVKQMYILNAERVINELIHQ